MGFCLASQRDFSVSANSHRFDTPVHPRLSPDYLNYSFLVSGFIVLSPAAHIEKRAVHVARRIGHEPHDRLRWCIKLEACEPFLKGTTL